MAEGGEERPQALSFGLACVCVCVRASARTHTHVCGSVVLCIHAVVQWSLGNFLTLQS